VELVELDPEAPESSSSSEGQLPGSGMPSIRLATYVEWPSRSYDWRSEEFFSVS